MMWGEKKLLKRNLRGGGKPLIEKQFHQSSLPFIGLQIPCHGWASPSIGKMFAIEIVVGYGEDYGGRILSFVINFSFRLRQIVDS